VSIEKAYILISIFLFLSGLLGVIIRKNLITLLISTELMLNGVNLALASVDKMVGGVGRTSLCIVYIGGVLLLRWP
jgi:NADH-quinone oxidoreductase subunit K